MKTVDARGFSCPEPVLRTRNALKSLSEGELLEVLVETVTSRENVRRFALTKRCQVETHEAEGGFRLIIQKS